jgi:hypothetical protein
MQRLHLHSRQPPLNPIFKPAIYFHFHSSRSATTIHATAIPESTQKDTMAQDPRELLVKAEKAAAGAEGGFSFFGGRQAISKIFAC